MAVTTTMTTTITITTTTIITITTTTKMRRLSISCCLALALAALPAYANDTSLHDGAYGPEPVGGGLTGRESVIRMVREHLVIAFGRDATTVSATFTFSNTLPNETAHQLVGFPDFGAARAEAERRAKRGEHVETDGSDLTGPLQKMRTFVNGKETPAQLRYGFVKPDPSGPGWHPGTPANGMLMAWYAVPVAFPSGKEITVERRYVAPVGTNTLGLSFFRYVTHTGGIWNGTIGQLVADVTLEDGLKVSDLIWPGQRIPEGMGEGVFPDATATQPARAAWKVLDDTHMRLTWNNFEPRTQRDRAGFALFAPRKD
jgi:hypothetical protein